MPKLSKIVTPTPSDLVVAQSVAPTPIADVALASGVAAAELEPHGALAAKIDAAAVMQRVPTVDAAANYVVVRR